MTPVGDPLQEVIGRMKLTERDDRAVLRAAIEGRAAEARGVLARLPEFVRFAGRAQLESRIRDRRLLDVVSGWDWARGNMTLHGPSDTGKTTAAAILFRILLARGVTRGGADWNRARAMRWFSATDLAAARREHPLGQGEAPEIRDASYASLLFLDDSGWDRDVQAVAEVLNTRYELERPTIVTTGRSPAQLLAHYSGAVVRRLLDAGGSGRYVIVDCFPPVAVPRQVSK